MHFVFGGKRFPQLCFLSHRGGADDVGRRLIKEEHMTPIREAEKTYRTWSSPILLELKEREHQLDPPAREALQNILVERRLVDSGNPDGADRRKAD